MNSIRKLFMMAAVFVVLVSTPVFATTPDVVCATVEVTECVSGYSCIEGSSIEMEIPPFFRINFGERTISGKRGNGQDLNIEILHSRRIEEGVMLQGVDEELGWTMILSETDGSMSLAVSGDLIGYMIFGNCTAL